MNADDLLRKVLAWCDGPEDGDYLDTGEIRAYLASRESVVWAEGLVSLRYNGKKWTIAEPWDDYNENTDERILARVPVPSHLLQPYPVAEGEVIP